LAIATAGHRRFRWSWPAQILTLVLLLSGCAAKTSATTDDASISTRVKIALLSDSQVGSLRLDAKTFQGVVTLSGTVRSQAEADQAIAVARKIKGVRDVKSELRIVTNPRS
jgi:hyperosmotically inducible protein